MLNTYYVMDGHDQLGPFALHELMERGIDVDDIVYSPIMEEWQKAMFLPELHHYFESREIYLPIKKNYAGFGWRLLAMIIDNVLIYATLVLFIAVVQGLLLAFFPDTAGRTAPTLADLSVLFAATGLLVYHSLFESLPTRGSIGKIICRLVVVKPNGKKLTFWNALGRNGMKFFSSMICYLGFLNALWDDETRTWHDKAANAYVLRRGK